MPARRALLSPGCKSFATKMPAFQAFKKAHPQGNNHLFCQNKFQDRRAGILVKKYMQALAKRPGGPTLSVDALNLCIKGAPPKGSYQLPPAASHYHLSVIQKHLLHILPECLVTYLQTLCIQGLCVSARWVA